MAIELPPKIWITGPKVDKNNLTEAGKDAYNANGFVTPSGLTPAARLLYDAYYAERGRRKDTSQLGVAQEAIDCLEELLAGNRSPSEVDMIYGYSLPRTTKPAQKEEARIIAELAVKPSKDVVQNPAVKLVVADVMTKYNIEEFVPKEVEPLVVEK